MFNGNIVIIISTGSCAGHRWSRLWSQHKPVEESIWFMIHNRLLQLNMHETFSYGKRCQVAACHCLGSFGNRQTATWRFYATRIITHDSNKGEQDEHFHDSFHCFLRIKSSRQNQQTEWWSCGENFALNSALSQSHVDRERAWKKRIWSKIDNL